MSADEESSVQRLKKENWSPIAKWLHSLLADIPNTESFLFV